MPAISSVTSLVGGLRVNYALGLAAMEDIGGKVAFLVSFAAQVSDQLSYVQRLLTSANLSAVGFSGLSTTAFSSVPTVIANFTST